MYKALIVDDESIIRKGIQSVIPWNTLGIDSVFTAGSAMEAVKIIKKEIPDILITDINMTQMTGLEMIEKVKKIRPDIRVIVITGYDLFDYAHKSIKMGVDNFFLKPVDEKELARTVSGLVEDLEKSRQKNIDERVQKVSARLFIEKVLMDLAHGQSTKEDFSDLQDICRFDVNQRVRLAILIPPLREQHRDFRFLSAKNMCFDLLDGLSAGITFQDERGKILLVLFEKAEKKGLDEFTNQICDILLDEMGEKPHIVVGKAVDGLINLCDSYDDAVHLLHHQELLSHESRDLSDFYDVFHGIKEKIFADVENENEVQTLFSDFEQAVNSFQLSDLQTRKFCFDMTSALFYSHILHVGEIPEGKLQVLIDALGNATRKEALEYTRNIISETLCISKRDMNSLVSRVKSIVNTRLSDNISVLSIASELFITPNYLSRLFKKTTGEGCNEYIVRKRIETAKHLLEVSEMNSGKIAGMVGYQDINYFSIAFKKHTGMTPTKYREESQRKTKTKDFPH